jgi:hypothetical protein
VGTVQRGLLGRSLLRLARVDVDLSKIHEAATHLAEAEKLLPKISGAPWLAAQARALRGELALVAGKLSEARKALDEASKSLKASLGSHHPLRLRVLATRVRLRLREAKAAPYPSNRALLQQADQETTRLTALGMRSLPAMHPDRKRYQELRDLVRRVRASPERRAPGGR